MNRIEMCFEIEAYQDAIDRLESTMVALQNKCRLQSATIDALEVRLAQFEAILEAFGRHHECDPKVLMVHPGHIPQSPNISCGEA